MSNETEKYFSLLLADNHSGSRELLRNLIAILKTDYEKLAYPGLVLDELAKELSEFQAITHFIDDFRNYDNKSVCDRQQFLQKKLTEIDNSDFRIFRNIAKIFNTRKQVVTISNSSTLQYVLTMLAKDEKIDKVWICESRPALEGRIAASILAEKNIPVRLVPENMLGYAVKNCDVALLGADRILGNGNIINKSGSLPLAVLCNFFAIPLYVLADQTKFSSMTNFTPLEKPVEEVWMGRPENVEVTNIYFEELERDLITEIISD